MRSAESDLRVHRERAAELISEVAKLNIRGFESLSTEDVQRTLVPLVVAWLDRSRQLISAVTSTVETGRHLNLALSSQHSIPAPRVLDSFMNTAGLRCIISDVAFVAELELAHRRKHLCELERGANALEVLTLCDGALRRIKKSLQAVDDAIASHHGLMRAMPTSELATSLRVRQAYALLRQSLPSEYEVQDLDLYGRMQTALAAICRLGSSDVYLELRVRDRAQIRTLLQRIRGWLNSAIDLNEGQHIWQDLSAFLRMLVLVNNRQELMAHDTALLAQLEQMLARQEVDAHVLAYCSGLRGLDDELDTMLDHPKAATHGDWLDTLARLSSRLTARGHTPC